MIAEMIIPIPEKCSVQEFWNEIYWHTVDSIIEKSDLKWHPVILIDVTDGLAYIHREYDNEQNQIA